MYDLWTFNMLIAGAHPGSDGDHHHLFRIELTMCLYMHTHSFPSYPPVHCTKHYIAYCFPNANQLTFSMLPTIMQHKRHHNSKLDDIYMRSWHTVYSYNLLEWVWMNRGYHWADSKLIHNQVHEWTWYFWFNISYDSKLIRNIKLQ